MQEWRLFAAVEAVTVNHGQPNTKKRQSRTSGRMGWSNTTSLDCNLVLCLSTFLVLPALYPILRLCHWPTPSTTVWV